MRQYLDNLQYILKHGTIQEDRTNVGTISVFGMQTRYNLRDGFPAVTTKKLAWNAVVSELLWFLEGSNDERRLSQILHGTVDPKKKTIWTENANADYWKKGQFKGDLGRVYGKQWREWRSPIINGRLVQGSTVTDQIKKLINGIKVEPRSRRHIVTAWNPGELTIMALPPCHIVSQFHVSNGQLSCQMYQRSCDMPLGGPFNIASYALLTYMVAQVCELEVGEFIHTIGDAHIYLNQVDKVKEQLLRTPGKLPDLWLSPDVTDIDNFGMTDIALKNYVHQGKIDFPFTV